MREVYRWRGRQTAQPGAHCTDNDPFGLTALGVFHTGISLVAVVSGILALVRNKQIRLDDRLG